MDQASLGAKGFSEGRHYLPMILAISLLLSGCATQQSASPTSLPPTATPPSASIADWGDDNWVPIGETDGVRFSIQKGSFEFARDADNKIIALLNGRAYLGKSRDVSLYRWYVKAESCLKRIGVLVSLDVQGRYLHETDFSFGAQSAASNIAEVICGLAEQQARKVYQTPPAGGI